MKKGFTLAEVLLTLAIIGVVAALTIPAVITKATNEQYVTGARKAFNTLKSIEREAIQENGEFDNFDWTKTGPVTFDTYFRPHFDILKDCGSDTDAGCFADAYKALGTGATPVASFASNSYVKFVTADGIAFAYTKSADPVAALKSGNHLVGKFYVDVNGRKTPNKFGRDVFVFDVFNDVNIKPGGAFQAATTADGVTVPNETTATINTGCNATTGTGATCAAKVLAEGKMDY